MESSNQAVSQGKEEVKKSMPFWQVLGLTAFAGMIIGTLLALGILKWIADFAVAVTIGLMYWAMWYHMCHPAATSNPYRPILRSPLKWWTWLIIGYAVLYVAVWYFDWYFTIAALAVALVLDLWKGIETWLYFRRTGEKP